MPSALNIFPIEWLYEPIVPPGPYAELYIDGKLIEGAVCPETIHSNNPDPNTLTSIVQIMI